jgi:hypothetical protein
MATYTWSIEAPNGALWTSLADWVGGATFPGQGDSAQIGDGTVDLTTALSGVAVTLQPLVLPFPQTFAVSGVDLAASGVELGSGTVLKTALGLPFQTITYDVIGSGTLDASSSIDCSAAPLTLELSGNFTSDGVVTGASLTITKGTGASGSTFFNNALIEVSGPLTIGAGVTIGGTGTIELDGRADVTINGTIGAGQTIVFADAPSSNEIVGTLDLGNITQFQGTIELDANHQIVVSGVTGSLAGGVVTFSNDSTLDVVPVGDASSIEVFSSLGIGEQTTIEGIGALDVVTACFHAGTRIATERGTVAVERVRAGDTLRLARGGSGRVVWVGHRAVRCDRHPRPADVWPVRIRAGAFAAGVPTRDLLLSPDHAVAIGGHLIPVRHLTNGATIAQEPAKVARYHHIELARHDLLLAEGLAAESYLDTGNRSAFLHGGTTIALHPDFSRRIWAEAGCLPLIEAGPVLQAARRALLRRARLLGYCRTDNPALRVLADGQPVRPRRDVEGWFVRLPAGTRTVRLLSRVWVPAEARAGADDRRRLGVAIGRLWLDRREVALDSPALARGWHAPERDGRWTDGDAELAVAGARSLTFVLSMQGRYWRAAPDAATERRA